MAHSSLVGRHLGTPLESASSDLLSALSRDQKTIKARRIRGSAAHYATPRQPANAEEPAQRRMAAALA